MYPEDQPQEEGSAIKESLGRLDGAKMAQDRPMSSTETSMMHLETEIMKLDDEISTLMKCLKPVRNMGLEKAQAVNRTEPSDPTRPVSPLAQSVDEKANRIKQIRHRVRSLIESVDL